MKSLASKVKSLALKAQVLENCLVLGSRTALFFEWLKFCRSAAKFFSRPFFWRSPEKNFEDLFWGDRLKQNFGDLFFGEHLRLCPWSLASSIPVLGLESVCPRNGCPWHWTRIFLCPWPWPRLEPCVLNYTSVLLYSYLGDSMFPVA